VTRRPLILLTDDIAPVLEFHQIILERAGLVNILCTTDAREAIRLAREYVPDLIISDISKPDMSGFELLQRLREDQITKGIKFMFVTARSSAEQQAYAAGADGFITKPTHPSEFVAAVRALLHKD
jgi:CheY-like chemotaxis protein